MSETESGKLLILAVDRDGDLESKTRLRSPIYGRDQVVAAATQLAISDPEEADANALFAAVKECDRLRSQNEDCEVAVACGVPDRSLDADRKIRREAENIVGRDAFTGIVLVSDGAEDEQVIPIIQTIKPIVSVVRIVVKHSRTVEETYMVLGRYLRMLVYDPRYSRYVIGVPGAIFLFAGILILFGQAFVAGIGILLIVGIALLIRGFNIDRMVAGLFSNRPYAYLRLFSTLAAALIFLVGLSSGYTNMVRSDALGYDAVSARASEFLVYGPGLVGYYFQGAIALIWASFAIYLIGTLLAHIARGSARVWRDGQLIVVLGLLYIPTFEFSLFLTGQPVAVLLVSEILVSLAVIFVVVTAVVGRLRSRASLLKE